MSRSQSWTTDAGIYLDAAPLGAQVEETPAGGLRIPSHVTRVGVFEYRLTDGTTRREYRPPEEVFAAESLASYRDAAVCVGHPDIPIDGRTWSGVAVGHVSGDASQDGRYVLADVVVSDGETIAAVRARELVEVSCGYRADLDPTPGTSPDGEAYDGIQRNIRINHVGLGPRGWGRGGPEVRLLADSKTAIVKETNSMEVEELKARLDAAEARADALANEVAVRASERADLITVARQHLGAEYLRDRKDAAAASNEDILMAILKQACPGCDFAGKSPDFLYGALYAVTMAKAAPAMEEPAEEPMDALEAVPPAEDKPAPLAPEMPADMCGPEHQKMSADSRVFVVDHRPQAERVDPIAELRKRNANAWRIK